MNKQVPARGSGPNLYVEASIAMRKLDGRGFLAIIQPGIVYSMP
jgi:hypothetical protein